MNSDRRAHHRFIPDENACVSTGSETPRFGRLPDISPGGASFERILQTDPRTLDVCAANICPAPRTVHLHGTPCSMVYDIWVAEIFSPFSSTRTLPTRVCGLQFRSASLVSAKSNEWPVPVFLRAFNSSNTEETFSVFRCSYWSEAETAATGLVRADEPGCPVQQTPAKE